MNRFSRGPIAADVQSNFIPLPIDAIARQIDRKQQQYDTTKAQLGAIEDTVLGVRGLSPDTETLKGIQNQYNEEILKGIEEVGGDYSRLGGLTDITARKLKKDLSSGHLAAIQSNYLAAQEHQDTLKKMRESGRIGDRGFEQGMRSISDFEGTKETPTGSYTSANFYTPVKEISLPEAGQKYAKASADQYLATGQRTLDATTVADNTYNNLINDESVMSNAREEIKHTHGKLSPEREDILTKEYLRTIANNAGTERAFLEQFKPEKSTTDEDGNPVLFGYDVTTANPTKSGITGKIQTIKEYHDKTKAAISAEYYARTGGSRSITGVPTSFITSEELERQTKEKDKALGLVSDSFKTTISNDPLLYDRLNLMGINPEKASEVELKQALDYIEGQDNSSRNTKLTIVRSSRADREFEARNNTEFIKDGPIVDINNKPLSPEERKEIVKYMTAPAEKGGGKLINGGAVYGGGTEGQPWPEGTIKVGAGDKTIMILPYNTNSPAYTLDRLHYVFTPNSGGYTEYQNGKYKEVLQQVKNPANPEKLAARRYRIDASGNTIPTNEYYVPNEGEDRNERPFKLLIPQTK